jgi:hypothetical protein
VRTERPLRQADHLSKRVLPCVLITLRNLQCEEAKVLARIVEPLMMMTFFLYKRHFSRCRSTSIKERITSGSPKLPDSNAGLLMFFERPSDICLSRSGPDFSAVLLCFRADL